MDTKKQVLKLEVAVLKKLQPCPYVVSFVTCGRHGDFNYLVMELLGENISDLRRRQVSGRFSIVTTCRLAMQMIRAIEAVHNLGYLHRDIKPSNFAVGLSASKKNRVYMIDFGLSRRYVLPSGKVRPPRDSSGFRGTARYASINAHLSKDLARRDDLWSLLYMLIEFANGILPWRRIKDKDHVGEMKVRCNTAELVADLPKEFRLLWEHLQSLRYEDKPDYQMLYDAFSGCIFAAGGDPESTPFDWEFSVSNGGRQPRTLARLQDLASHVVVSHLDLYPATNPLFAKLSAPLKSQMLTTLSALSNRGKFVPEASISKLVGSDTVALNLVQFGGAITPTVFSNMLARCPNAKELSLGPVADPQLQEATKVLRGLRGIALEAPPKLLSFSKGIRPLVDANAVTLTSIHLAGAESIKDKIVEHILRECINLESLDLRGCKKVKGTCFSSLLKVKSGPKLRWLDVSSCELNKSGFKALTKACGTLKSFRGAPLITSFSISSADVIQILHRTQLTSFDLHNEHLELDSILMEISKGSPCMESLTLEGMGITDFGVQNLLRSCTNLQQLAFPCGDGIGDASLNQIAQNAATLTALKLKFVTRANRNLVSDRAVRALLSACTDIEELHLSNCLLLAVHCFPEEVSFERLTRLNLSECLQVDDVTLERFVQAAPNLQLLNLDSLNQLTSSSLSHIGLWCLALERLSLCNCACFEDEFILRLLETVRPLFIELSRFPSPSLKVDVVVHYSNVTSTFAEVGNVHRLQALEKKRIYGLVN